MFDNFLCKALCICQRLIKNTLSLLTYLLTYLILQLAEVPDGTIFGLFGNGHLAGASIPNAAAQPSSCAKYSNLTKDSTASSVGLLRVVRLMQNRLLFLMN